MATHLGIVDEEAIDNMSFLFFEDVLSELGHKLVYDAVVNYAGNSFCEKAWDMIMDHNPFNIEEDGEKMNKKVSKTLSELFNSSNIKVKK